jgi:hypothetical protein
MRFTALEDFWSEELQSQIAKGLSYEVKEEHGKIFELAPKWLKEGKIREGGPEPKVSATGEVGETKIVKKEKN